MLPPVLDEELEFDDYVQPSTPPGDQEVVHDLDLDDLPAVPQTPREESNKETTEFNKGNSDALAEGGCTGY